MANTPVRTANGPTEEQFFQRIRSSTFARIKFPKQFYKKYVEGNDSDVFVTLKSPRLSRPLIVIRVGDKLIDGWSAFVRFHDLKLGDYVHFSHEGNFVFYVTTFSKDGNRILYGNNETSQVRTPTFSIPGQQRKYVHGTHEAGSLLPSSKKTKKDDTPQSIVSDSCVLAVTKKNIDRKSVYIPMKFARENCLEDRDLSFLRLLDSNHNVWGNEVTVCSDRRLKITGGWGAFCRDNNLQPGDYCELKLLPGTEEIMLQLVGVRKEGKKPARGIGHPSYVAKEEQYELEEDDGPANDLDVEMISMESFYKFSSGKSKLEVGQSSRK